MEKLLKKAVSIFCITLIRLIEYIESIGVDWEKEGKIQDTIDISHLGLKAKSDIGFVPLTHVHRTKPLAAWKVESGGRAIRCADKHIFFDSNMSEATADCMDGACASTDQGASICKASPLGFDCMMFDVTVGHDTHRLYEDGFLCHQTTTSSIFIAWYLCFQYDKNAFFLANKGATTSEVVKKTKNVLQFLPFFLKPGIVSLNVFSLSFDNGCSLQAQTTTENSGIGFTIHMLYLDEFAHVADNIVNAFWENVYPTLSSSKISRIIITSTPNGFNKFYEIYNDSVLGQNKFKNMRIDWWQVPGRDEAWKKREIENLGSEEAFNEQYNNQFYKSSSILLDGQTLERIKGLSKEYATVEDFAGYFEDEDDELEKHTPMLRFNPELVAEYDLNRGFHVVSVDISEGVGGDYTVVNIFRIFVNRKAKNVKVFKDAFGLEQVGCFRSNRTGDDALAKMVYILCMKVLNPENTKLIVEYNTYGKGLIDSLYTVFGEENEWFDEIFVKYNHKNESKAKKPGLKLKSDNKKVFCGRFKDYMVKERIVISEKNTVNEAFYFGKDKNGNYKSTNQTDDCIMSTINATTIFETEEFEEMCQDYYETLEPEEMHVVDAMTQGHSSGKYEDDDYDIYDFGGKGIGGKPLGKTVRGLDLDIF